jgi:DNA-binding phage protein
VNLLAEIRAGIVRVGWSEVARRSGMHRITLHRCFGKNGRGRPTLATIERVLPHIGLQLAIVEAKN